MKPTLIIQCADVVNGGSVRDYFVERDLPFIWHESYNNHQFPEPSEFDRVICLGSPNSVHDSAKIKHIGDLLSFTAALVKRDIPYLGICFGSQLLARILGAEVRPLDKPEMGIYRIRLTETGLADPIFKRLTPDIDVMEWHGETFDLPPGAELLAEGDSCRNQAFRSGNAVGLQFHPEAVPSEIRAWADRNLDKLASIGKTAASVVEECRASEDHLRSTNYQLLDNFLAM